jgi:Cu(I)/Ag(I) efflux system membrane fusion protein
MFATLYFDVMIGDDILVVPTEAILATGERDLVFVRESDGMLYSREIVLGPRAGGLVQVLSGLEEGATVVASANFLMDAESRLASAGAMAGMDHGTEEAAQQPPTEHQHDQ